MAAIERSLSLPWFDDSDVGSQEWEVAVQDVQSYIEKLQTGATAGELARRLVYNSLEGNMERYLQKG